MPAQIPADTQALWRGSQEIIADLLLRYIELMTQQRDGTESRYSQETMDAANSMIARISHELIAGSDIDYDDHGLSFSSLKADEDAFLALRRISDQPIFESLSWGAALVPDEMPRLTFGARIFLPTDDPQRLVEGVRDFCEAQGGCKYLLDLSTQEGFAMIDTVRPDDREAEEWAVSSDDIFDFDARLTPARQAFLSAQYEAAVYVPSIDFGQWAAVAILRELNDIYDHYPELPITQTLTEQGASLGRLVSMTSPATAEVEDMTIGMRLGEARGMATTVATTHTPMGQQIFEAADRAIRLPAIALADPVIELEWSADLDAAIERAARPHWLGGAAGRAREQWQSHGMGREFWQFLGALVEQPVGLLKAAEVALVDEQEIPFDLVHGLQAGRARLGFVADDSAVGGHRLAGGILMATQPDSPASQRLGDAFDAMEAQGVLEQFGLVANRTVVEGLDVVSIHDPELGDPFGELTDVEEFYALAQPSRVPADTMSLFSRRMGMMLGQVPASKMSIETSMTGRAVDIQIDDISGPSPQPFATEVDLVQDPALPQCQRRAQALAARIYRRLYPPVGAGQESPAEIIAEARRKFGQLRDDCDHEELDAVVEAWNEFVFDHPELRQAEPNE